MDAGNGGKKLDFSVFDTVASCDKGARFELIRAVDRQPSGTFITVYGKDSEVFKEHMAATINKQLKRDALERKRGSNSPVKTVAQIEAESIEMLVVCTKGWENMPNPEGGGELPFSVENAKMIYTKSPFIRQQVDEAIGDLSNFM